MKDGKYCRILLVMLMNSCEGLSQAIEECICYTFFLIWEYIQMNEHSGLNMCCILVWFDVDSIIVKKMLSKL